MPLRCHFARPTLLALLVGLPAAACGGDDVTSPTPVDGANVAYAQLLADLESLETELLDLDWQEQGQEGIAGAVLLLASTRALGPLLQDLNVPDAPSYLVLLHQLDASQRAVDRLRLRGSPRFAPALDRIAGSAADLRARLVQGVAFLLPAAAESDVAARLSFETGPTFVALEGAPLPTPQIRPLLVVEGLQVDGGCVDADGAGVGGLTVQVSEATSGVLLAAGSPGAAVTLDHPTWVTASVAGDAPQATSCELLLSGTRPGVSDPALAPDQIDILNQRIDTLASQIRVHELDVRTRAEQGPTQAARDLNRELWYRVEARRQRLIRIRLLVELGRRGSDEAEILEREHAHSREEYDEMVDEEKAAAEEAKEEYQEALRILQELNERESQIVLALLG